MLASHFVEWSARAPKIRQSETTVVALYETTDLIRATNRQTFCVHFECHHVADETASAAVCSLQPQPTVKSCKCRDIINCCHLTHALVSYNSNLTVFFVNIWNRNEHINIVFSQKLRTH